VLDWITHRPDMPLYPGSAKVGLGLWNSIPGTIAVEVAMFILGVWIYARSTRTRNRLGTRAFAAFVGFLLAAYAANLGPPPPSVAALVWVGIAGAAVFLVWTWWFDRHRNPVT
jgi:Flp pilus assembly protein TadB